MNLVHEAWVPTTCGLRSLMQVFSEKEILDISGDAQERISLYRLFVGISTAAVIEEGLDWDDGDDLAEIGPAGLAEAARKYLEAHEHEFQLYDSDRPWLQTPESVFIYEGTPSGVEVLREHFCFDAAFRDDRRPFCFGSDEDLALAVLVAQVFSVGRKDGTGSTAFGKRIVYPPTKEGKEGKSARPTPNTVDGGRSLANIMLSGRSLQETVYLNMFHKDALESIYRVGGIGKPFWEHDPRSGPYQHSGSFFARLIPAHLKHLRISEDRKKVYYAAYQDEKPWPEEDTYFASEKYTFKNNESKTVEVRLRVKTIPDPGMWWRDLSSFLPDSSIGDHRSLFNKGKLSVTPSVSVLCLGARCSSNSGIYQITSLENSVSVLKSSSIHNAGFRSKYREGLEAAEKMMKHLKIVAKSYCEDLGINEHKHLQEKVAKQFWELLSHSKQLLLKTAEQFEAGDSGHVEGLAAWHKAIKSAAMEAFAELDGSTMREKRAYVRQIPSIRRMKL